MSNIVVLISGNGSNLQAIIDATHSGKIPGKVCAVISNRADAYGLVRAKQANIPTHVLSHQDFKQREDYDAALAACIDTYKPDVVVLAGFMRILGKTFVHHFAGRLINIHPSLLPKYPGLNTHEQALQAGDKEHGATVHFVTEALDGGPIIAYATVPVMSEDDTKTLQNRVHQIEHLLYPQVINWLVTNRVELQEEQVYFDEQALPAEGMKVYIS